MSIESIGTGFGRLIGKNNENKANQRAMEEARRQRFSIINSLDWEPTYASQVVQPYQKTQSPLASAFINSYLMGDNPASISSTRAGAPQLKAAAQTRMNANFGTPQDLLAQQTAAQTVNPYTFNTPTRPVMNQQNETAMYKGAHPNADRSGFDQDLYKQLVDKGLVRDGDDTWAYKPELAPALKGALAAGDVDAAKFLLNPTLDRPHSMFQRRQKRKANNKAKALVAKYTPHDDDEEED